MDINKYYSKFIVLTMIEQIHNVTQKYLYIASISNLKYGNIFEQQTNQIYFWTFADICLFTGTEIE